MPFAERDLQHAIEAGSIAPYFQPLVELRTGAIKGFEVLARWKHPTRGVLLPVSFIPLAEHCGLVNRLTATLLTQAFSAVRSLPKTFGLSINLAPSQLHNRSLPTCFERMADQFEFDLKRLTVELTETALVDDLDVAESVAATFKQLGIRLALDDFGTGYSSLRHLQSLPFDELKVDISFVRSMVESRQSRKITAAVVGLGTSLGLQTVAEGIDDQSQANLLAWQGCHLGQGFLYSHPFPAEKLAAALSQSHPGVCRTAEVPASADPFLTLGTNPTERLSQLRAIYDGAPVGLAFIDRDMRFVNLNQRLADMNGYSVQSHLGRKVSEMAPPEAFRQFEPFLKRAVLGETFAGFEVQVAAQPGEGRPEFTIVSYQPVRDEAGELLGVSASVADITGIKQKEQALRESEDHYRHMVELNPQAPWVMDAAGDEVVVSSRWQEITGLTPEQNNRRGWIKAVHPKDRPAVVKLLESSLATGAPLDMEYRVRSQGEWIWMRSRGAPRRNETGDIIRWYGSVESIDLHKRADDAMRANEARLRAVFQAVPVGIVLADACTGKVLDANPRAEQLLGFHFEPGMIWDADGWYAYDTSGRKIIGSDLPLLRAMRCGTITDAEEVLLHRPDGSEVWLSLTAAPIRHENGAACGGILVVQDIDTSKRVREHLLDLARELTLVASLPQGLIHHPVVS